MTGLAIPNLTTRIAGSFTADEKLVAVDKSFRGGGVKIYNDQITVQSKMPREIINISTQVKAAMEKSGFRDGIVLVSSLHTNSAVIVNDEEPGFLEDLDRWLTEPGSCPRRLQAPEGVLKAIRQHIFRVYCCTIR